MDTSKDARALSSKGTLVGLVLAEEGKLEAASGYLWKVKRMGDQHMDEYFVALKSWTGSEREGREKNEA